MSDLKKLSMMLEQDASFETVREKARELLAQAPEGATFVRLPIPKHLLLGDAGYLLEHVRAVRAWDVMTGETLTRLDVAWS